MSLSSSDTKHGALKMVKPVALVWSRRLPARPFAASNSLSLIEKATWRQVLGTGPLDVCGYRCHIMYVW